MVAEIKVNGSLERFLVWFMGSGWFDFPRKCSRFRSFLYFLGRHSECVNFRLHQDGACIFSLDQCKLKKRAADLRPHPAQNWPALISQIF